MGILPNSQFGDIAVVDIKGGIDIPSKRVGLTSSSHTSSTVKVGAQFSAPNNVTLTNSTGNLSTGELLSVAIPSSSHQLESSFSILAQIRLNSRNINTNSRISLNSRTRSSLQLQQIS